MIKGNKYYKQGEYIVQNKQKFLGDKNPHYRSSWEQRCCKFFDENINVKKWGFECIDITYYSPIDHKIHRYFPDFYFEMIDINGKTQKYLVEVKPKEQTVPPKEPKKRTQKRMNRFLLEAKTYIINKSKWDAAKKFCATRGIQFKIITDIEIFNLHD